MQNTGFNNQFTAIIGVLCPTGHITGHFGDKTFKVIAY